MKRMVMVMGGLPRRMLAVKPVANVSSRAVSLRCWNVVRYHPELRQAVKLSEDTSSPVVHRPTDVMVNVLASSVNPLDVAMTRGYGSVLLTLWSQFASAGIDRLTYDRLPLTLGRDFVGRVVTCGGDVTRFKGGDLVWGTVAPHENGSHADFVVTSENSISTAPSNLSTVEAAGLPYVALTAWSALTTFGGLNAQNARGKEVLVLGGSGGVGCFAIQLLKHWGAQVTSTCSPTSTEWLQSLTGLDRCLHYQQLEGFLRSHRGAFDLILDASTHTAAHKNREIVLSSINPKATKLTTYVTLTSPLLRNLDQHGIIPGAVSTMADAAFSTVRALQHGVSFRWAYYWPNQEALQQITHLVEQGAIKPFTSQVFQLDHAIEAYETMERRPLCGKVVLQHSH